MISVPVSSIMKKADWCCLLVQTIDQHLVRELNFCSSSIFQFALDFAYLQLERKNTDWLQRHSEHMSSQNLTDYHISQLHKFDFNHTPFIRSLYNTYTYKHKLYKQYNVLIRPFRILPPRVLDKTPDRLNTPSKRISCQKYKMRRSVSMPDRSSYTENISCQK